MEKTGVNADQVSPYTRQIRRDWAGSPIMTCDFPVRGERPVVQQISNISLLYDAKAKRTRFDLRSVTVISPQIASRFCWRAPPILAVCGPRHRRGYLSGGHRPQA